MTRAGKAVTVKQIQGFDRLAIKQIGIPSIALMENAGRAVARVVVKELGEKNKRPVVILCGPGNNGGDGFVAARHLLNTGCALKIFLIGRIKNLKSDARVNYDILKNLRQPILELCESSDSFRSIILNSSLVVDAIFGVGLNREIAGSWNGIIETVNAAAKRVVAVDIPSGLDGTTGKILGTCVKANTTVTFSFIKKGFLIHRGPEFTGKVIVADIGIPLNNLRGLLGEDSSKPRRCDEWFLNQGLIF